MKELKSVYFRDTSLHMFSTAQFTILRYRFGLDVHQRMNESGLLFSNKEEQSHVICGKMDVIRGLTMLNEISQTQKTSVAYFP